MDDYEYDPAKPDEPMDVASQADGAPDAGRKAVLAWRSATTPVLWENWTANPERKKLSKHEIGFDRFRFLPIFRRRRKGLPWRDLSSSGAAPGVLDRQRQSPSG